MAELEIAVLTPLGKVVPDTVIAMLVANCVINAFVLPS